MKQYHILFYYPSLGLGGHQTQLMQLAEALKNCGQKVSWLYSHDPALKDEASQYCQIKKIWLPRFNKCRFGVGRIINRFLYFNLLEWHLTHYVNNNNVDVLISSNTIDSRVVNQLARKHLIKHYRFVNGSMLQVEPFHLACYKKNKVDQYINGYFGWPAVFEELKSQDVSENKFFYLPFAVNTQKFYPLPKEDVLTFRKQLGISNDDTVIGWIGRTALNMQLWDTVRLGRILKGKGIKGFKLLFVGGGDAFEHLRQEITKNNLEDITILTGWIPYHEVNKYVNAMDIVPLLESDPHGGSIVREAMACGRLALSVNGPSGTQSLFMKPHATILVQSDNYLAEATDAVASLIGKKDIINRYGEMARKYVIENLSFYKQAETIINVINSK